MYLSLCGKYIFLFYLISLYCLFYLRLISSIFLFALFRLAVGSARPPLQYWVPFPQEWDGRVMNIYLLMIYLTTLAVVQDIEWRILRRLMNNELERLGRKRSWPDLRCTIPPFSWVNWGEPRKLSGKIGDVLTEIRTWHLPNAGDTRCRIRFGARS
jgi:hypothetical protein